jgi:hypothetical protein
MGVPQNVFAATSPIKLDEIPKSKLIIIFLKSML